METKKTKRPDPHAVMVGEVMKKYIEGGWSVYKNGGISDLVATKSGRWHYIKVAPDADKDAPTINGEFKSAFVQNAVSNNAEPVYALVSHVMRNIDGVKTPTTQIRTVDVNTTGRVVLARKK
jgi:hypothetical protein